LVLSGQDVESVIRDFAPEELLALMARTFRSLSVALPGISSPHRTKIETDHFVGLVMPSRIAFPDEGGTTAIKVVSLPKGKHSGLPASTVVLDEKTGNVKAIVNAGTLTALRTAAGSALATKLVGPANPTHLALFGAGAQIYHHVRLLIFLYPTISHCTIVNRRLNERVTQLSEKLQSEHRNVTFSTGSFAVEPDAPPSSFSLESVVREADIICAATPSDRSLFQTKWVKAGAHINLVGSYTPQMREVDDDLLHRAGIVVLDSREACLTEAGEVISSLSSGIMTQGGLVEVGELVGWNGEPRVESCQRVKDGGTITVFKSVGVGIQDSAIAGAVVDRAEAMGKGYRIPYD